jgi:hypothetical protein
MGYILKNTSGLVNTRLTDTGRLKLSQGNFNIAYFQIGDSEVSYNALPSSTYNQYNSWVLEPSFNAQNSSGVPQSNKENIKYPFYVDGTTGNTYGIPFMDSIVSPVFNTAAPRGFFSGTSVDSTIVSWSALTNNFYAINSNYLVRMNTLVGSNVIEVVYSGCNTTPVRTIAVGDIITIFFDGIGENDCICYNVPTPTPTPTVSVTPSLSPSFAVSPTPTPSSTNTDPCGTPTPTPTPSKSFCLTPTPSNACPTTPEPDCVVSISSCYPILTYKVIDVCFNKITLDRNTPDFSFVGGGCYARTIVYPPTLTSLYDSVTPMNHWSDSVINFESVCYTDEFDVKVWNMNIPWSENPAGLNSLLNKDYTTYGSINYLGSKEYFGYASSSGQTDTSFTYYYDSFDNIVVVQPEEQKTIAIVHYTNQTVDLFYGEKFALEPFDETTDDTTGQARNFKVHLPWLMWHKNPECCLGQTFWVDPPGYENLNLFEQGPYYLKSNKNPNMNDPGIRYYHLYDTNTNIDGFPSRVGKVFPDSKIIIFDDEEIVAAMSYKSNRNWTLPTPQISLITPNTCGLDNFSTIGILTGDTESLYVTYRFTNDSGFTNSLHCNHYRVIQGPNLTCNPSTSQNVAVRFGAEFGCMATSVAPIIPCWYSGFTFWFLPAVETSPTTYEAVPFVNTGQNLNGFPIFRSLVDEGKIYNIFYDGNDWIFRFNSSSTDTPFNFTNGGLIGNFTIDIEGGLSGYTECNNNPLLCVTTCVQNEDCVVSTYSDTLSGTTKLYLSNFDLTSRLVYYNSNWEIYSADTRIAILTGLTNNDIPIGTWTPNTPSLTGLTTSLFESCASITCSSYSASTTANSATIKVVDCSFVISDETTITSGITYSGCAITVDASLDPAIVQVSGDTEYGSFTGTCPAYSAFTASTVCIDFCNLSPGFYAQRFEIICQKVTGDEKPNSSEWKIIDFTDQLTATTNNGLITQSGITGTTFVITDTDYENAPFYNLNDYIDLPATGETSSQLNFGDEYYFYGTIETDIQATIYEMRYKINLSQVEFQTSSNPTWTTSLKPYVTEVGLYDTDKNLLIISKMQSPILRQGVQQFLIKFDI